MVFMASGQYTLSMRTLAPFQNVVRSNERHDRNGAAELLILVDLLCGTTATELHNSVDLLCCTTVA